MVFSGMDLLGEVCTPLALARWVCCRGCYFHDKAEKYNERHNEIHIIVMISLLVIALALWMYDHVFIMKNYFCKGR